MSRTRNQVRDCNQVHYHSISADFNLVLQAVVVLQSRESTSSHEFAFALHLLNFQGNMSS